MHSFIIVPVKQLDLFNDCAQTILLTFHDVQHLHEFARNINALAGKYHVPDNNFISTSALLNALPQIAQLIRDNRKIDAIKLLRSVSNLGLKEAKDYVEQEFPRLNVVL